MSQVEGAVASLTGSDPGGYTPHRLHHGARSYVETNCYTDILVELIHARGLEPLAAMGFLVAIDFEGDQFTFFKPPPADLELLYGIDIHEMQLYRSAPEQIEEQLRQDRTVIVELDAWYLPDTASTSYRRSHVKTSAAIEAIDLAGRRLRYFHNGSLHELSDEDYNGVFRVGLDLPGDVLPPYTELVRFDVAGGPVAAAELRSMSRELLANHLRRRPSTNPFARFGTHLGGELPTLVAGDFEEYHEYVFATLRMAGSAFEVCETYVDWLFGSEGEPAAAAMGEIVEGCKLLAFKLARRRPFDPSDSIDALAGAWQRTMVGLEAALS